MESINKPETMPVKRQPGRPAGSRNRRTLFVESLFRKDAKELREIVATAIRLAREGNVDFAKLILDRVSPAPKGRFIRMGMPVGLGLVGIAAAYDSILAAIGDGLITISEGTELGKLLEMQAKVLEASEIERRLKALEDAENKRLAA
jgi:hypothetical protein